MVKLCDNQFDLIRCRCSQQPFVLLNKPCARHQSTELAIEKTFEAIEKTDSESSMPNRVELSGSESSIPDTVDLAIQQQPSIEREDRRRCYAYILAILSVSPVIWYYLADQQELPSVASVSSMTTSVMGRSRRLSDSSQVLRLSNQASRNVSDVTSLGPYATIRNRYHLERAEMSIPLKSYAQTNGTVAHVHVNDFCQSRNLSPRVPRNEQPIGRAVSLIPAPPRVFSNGHTKFQSADSREAQNQSLSTAIPDSYFDNGIPVPPEIPMLGAASKAPAMPDHAALSSSNALKVDVTTDIPVPLQTQIPLLGDGTTAPLNESTVSPKFFEKDNTTAVLSAPAPAKLSVSCGYVTELPQMPTSLQNTSVAKTLPLIGILFRDTTYQCFGSAPDDDMAFDEKWPQHGDEHLEKKEGSKIAAAREPRKKNRIAELFLLSNHHNMLFN